MKTSLKNLTKEHTYYKNPSNPNCVDLIIIRKNVQHSHVTEIGLFDFCKMIVAVLKMRFRKF